LPKTIAAIIAATALLAFLCLFPIEFKLKGDGQLKPTLRQHVWAAVDGEIKSVLVSHDQEVTKGQKLLEQESLELERKLEELNGQFHEAEEDLKSTRNELDYNEELTETEQSQKESHIMQLNARGASLQMQKVYLDNEHDRLTVLSPLGGRVVTWNVEDRLHNRYVHRGDELLEIADPASPWELEVTMPESRMGHISEAQTKAQKEGKKLEAQFILAVNPGEEIEGVVEEIHRSAEVRGQNGNTVLMRVSFDQDRLYQVVKDPKIGSTATAKVLCGKKPIGYVWFHDLIDFVRSKILFRML
jgi:multidrug resistance efflux pump